jgi:hypothetical protein
MDKTLHVMENRLSGLITICSHIDNDAIGIIKNISQENIEHIQFGDIEPNEGDLKILNRYLGENKKAIFHNIRNSWWLSYLPNLERFGFNDFTPDAIELIRKNKVRYLDFVNEPGKKYDLSVLSGFKHTLEYLGITGEYKNTESIINEMTGLKILQIRRMAFDVHLLESEKSNIENIFYYGSKISGLDDLSKLKRLKKINLKKNIKIENIDFIGNMHNLEAIDLSFFSKLTIFPNVDNLKKLKTVFIWNCNRLNNIENLRRLKNVNVKVWGCDLVHYEN